MAILLAKFEILIFTDFFAVLAQGVTQSKRIIHEYHRISIEPEKIMSNTVIILSALPSKCRVFLVF